MKSKLNYVWIILGFSVSVYSQHAPEVHQLAAVAQFTGIYSYIGSYIAVRELYFMVGLITILLAGNVVIAFFQLPSIFLPVYKNQRRSLDEDVELNLTSILEILDILEEAIEKW